MIDTVGLSPLERRHLDGHLVSPQPIVVVDLDGTLANNQHRRHLVPPHRAEQAAWLPFNEACDQDVPRYNVCSFVVALSFTFKIVYATSRPEAVREKTATWLAQRVGLVVPRERLLMRPNEDGTPNHTLKIRQIKEAGIDLHDVIFAIDDDPRVVRAWRANNVTCLDVGR